VFTAFVSDVFSRRIIRWRCWSSMPTKLPLDALEWRCGPVKQQATPAKRVWKG
jgi:hypothetical protein